MSAVALENVRKSFGSVEVVKGVSLSVEKGEFVVFVGPSGCGKSTLLRMIAGLETITSGDLTIGGERMNEVDPARRGVAMVFQSYALYPHLSVRDNMALALRFAGVPKAEIEARVAEAAKTLELERYLDRKPRALSGGQRQRVAIGRAIVRQPQVFLFDEPLSNLDAELRVHMRVEIAKLHRRFGATIVYVTHDQVEAMTLADRIVVLRDGLVEQIGRPLDLYDDPSNIFVAGFIGSPKMNLLSGVVEKTSGSTALVRLVDYGDTRIEATAAGVIAGAAVTVGLRPEHLALDASGSFRVNVEILEHLGGETLIHATGGAQGALVTLKVAGERVLKGGDEIRAAAAPGKALLFETSGRRIR